MTLLADQRFGRSVGLLELGLVFLFSVSTLLLAVHDIGSKSLVGDEAFTAHVMSRSTGALLRIVIFQEPFGGLYYLLLRPWTAIFGTGEAALRWPSALCVAAAIPVVWVTGREMVRRSRPALGTLTTLAIAAALVLSSAFVMHYAQVARAYALAFLLVAATFALVLYADRVRTARGWLAYGIVAALAAYAHFFAVFLITVQLVWAWSRASEALRAWWPLPAGIALAIAPLAVGIMQGPERHWIAGTTPGSAAGVVLELTGANLDGQTSVVAATAVALEGAVMAFGVIWAGRRAGWSAPELMLAAAIVVPILGAALISLVKPILVARYLIVVVPALVLLLAISLSRIARPFLAALLACTVVTIAMLQVGAWYRSNTNLDLRGAAAAILAEGAATDGVVVFPPARFKTLAVGYYLDRLSAAAKPDLRRIAGVAGASDRVRRLHEAYPRLWLLLTVSPGSSRPVDRWLAAFVAEFGQPRIQRIDSMQLFLFEGGRR